MKLTVLIGFILAIVVISANAQTSGVRLIRNDKARRVDVWIDGRPFTSYIWPNTLKKPVLYPLRTANGTQVTRGFPLDPRVGESVDHPHQVGLWFNYGDVNGVDFWNNSFYRSPQETAKMGTIVHRRVVSLKSGKTHGELVTESDWLMPDGRRILRETSKFIFRGTRQMRVADRITTLTALGEKVVFNDSKEGLLGLRVRRELEQPVKEAILLTGKNGKPGTEKVLDNTNVSGQFRSSEGLVGDDVWGTRGRWAELSGTVGKKPVAIVIFDNPKNVGFPTYWMARGYGLFGANPLGQKAYSTEKKEPIVQELKYTLEPKQAVSFRFRVMIASNDLTAAQIESEYQKFIREIK